MLIGAASFLSNFDLLRTVAICGPKGSGKDLLAFELSRYFLERGFRFSTNQQSVWNDPYYTKYYYTDLEFQELQSRFRFIQDKGLTELKKVSNRFVRDLLQLDIPDDEFWQLVKPEFLREMSEIYGRDDEGFFEKIPDVGHRVIVLSEGGKYLREWKYFQDLYEFTRKMKVYLLIPSIRLPHENICEMTVLNIFPLSMLGLGSGGLFQWEIAGQGLKAPIQGHFFFRPGAVGLYNTDDYTVAPTEIVNWFTRQIDYDQRKKFGRSDGISAMAVNGEAIETDAFAQLARENRQTALSLQKKNARR